MVPRVFEVLLNHIVGEEGFSMLGESSGAFDPKLPA